MDIENEEDIKLLVDSFYGRVRADVVLGPIFNKIIGDDWSHHLPIMYNFWGMILLQKGKYSGNPVQKHITVDKQMPLEPAHYERWFELWRATIAEHFEGPVADEALNRATLMLHLISMKVQMARSGNFIQ